MHNYIIMRVNKLCKLSYMRIVYNSTMMLKNEKSKFVIFTQQNEILPKIQCSVFKKIGYIKYDDKQPCILLFIFVSFKYFWSQILPQIKHSIDMENGQAQLHMMVNSCINFNSCWVNRSFLNLLLTKLNSYNL